MTLVITKIMKSSFGRLSEGWKFQDSTGGFLKMHSGKSLFPNICGLPLWLFFWLKWAGYLAVAGLNLLAHISDRISPYGV